MQIQEKIWVAYSYRDLTVSIHWPQLPSRQISRMGRHDSRIYRNSWYRFQRASLSVSVINFRWGNIVVSYQYVGFTKTIPAHLSKEESFLKSYTKL